MIDKGGPSPLRTVPLSALVSQGFIFRVEGAELALKHLSLHGFCFVPASRSLPEFLPGLHSVTDCDNERIREINPYKSFLPPLAINRVYPRNRKQDRIHLF